MIYLLLVFSVKTQFNTVVDVKQLGPYSSHTACVKIAEKIVDSIHTADQNSKVSFFCEDGK